MVHLLLHETKDRVNSSTIQFEHKGRVIIEKEFVSKQSIRVEYLLDENKNYKFNIFVEGKKMTGGQCHEIIFNSGYTKASSFLEDIIRKSKDEGVYIGTLIHWTTLKYI